MDFNIKNNQNNLIEVIQSDVRRKTVERLLTIRKSLNMTQADVAKKVGLKSANICRLEKGRTNFTLDMLVLISYAMGYDVEVSFCKREDA